MHILNEMVSPTTSNSSSPSGSLYFEPTTAPAGGLNQLEQLFTQTPVVPGDSDTLLEDLVNIISGDGLCYPDAATNSAPSGSPMSGLNCSQMFAPAPVSSPLSYAPLETPVPSTVTLNPWAFPATPAPLCWPVVNTASAPAASTAYAYEYMGLLQPAVPMEQFSQSSVDSEEMAYELGLPSRERSTSWSFQSESSPPTAAPTPITSFASSAPQSMAPSDCNEFDEAAISEVTSHNSGGSLDEKDIEELRRRRNNESSRRSRAKRKSRERLVFEELRLTEKRNADLRLRIARARQLYELMQESLVHCIRDGNAKL